MQEETVTSTANQPLPELSKIERRILGVLVEKGMTTPEQYPLTLNSLVSGCNQKSNRDPVTHYDEDAVMQAIDTLMQKGWMLSVQTSGGRTDRYRHQVRVKLTLNEMELAILTELWLRGRQQLGELRTRASRMSNMDSQELLKEQLESLLAKGYIQSTGQFSKRGVEVDHNFYTAAEQERRRQQGHTLESIPAVSSEQETSEVSSGSNRIIEDLQQEISELKNQLRELKSEFEDLKRQILG